MSDNNLQKRCRDCGKNKPLSEFYKAKTTLDRRGSYCKICSNKRTKKYQSKAYRRKHPIYKQGFKIQITTKICKECGLVKKADCFSNHLLCQDGKLAKCKQCLNEINKKMSAKKRKRLRQLQKEWREIHKDYLKEYHRDYQKKNKKACSKWRQKHREKFPEREKARQLVSRLINGGYLFPEPCMIPGCNSIEHIQSHHPDYTRPLEVVWLCRNHHYAVDNGKLKVKFEYVGWKVHASRQPLTSRVAV